MKRSTTIKNKIVSRISRKKSAVLVRGDFRDLAGYDQVGRALNELSRSGKLVRLGYGVYAKTKVSAVTGDPVPVKPLPQLAREAMKRLGVAVAPTKAETAYQSGRSTQVPTGRVIGVRERVSRKLQYKGTSIQYERTS